MEFMDLYDKKRNKLNKIHQRGLKREKGEFVLIVHACIKNSEGKYIIAKRAKPKSHAGKWEFPGGASIVGENSFTAINREVNEEIGLNLKINEGIVFHTEISNGFIRDTWVFYKDISLDKLSLQKEEVEDAKWASEEEILSLIKNKEFLPMINYYPKLFTFEKPLISLYDFSTKLSDACLLYFKYKNERIKNHYILVNTKNINEIEKYLKALGLKNFSIVNIEKDISYLEDDISKIYNVYCIMLSKKADINLIKKSKDYLFFEDINGYVE